MLSQTAPVIVIVTEDDDVRATLTALIESRGFGAIVQGSVEEFFEQRKLFTGVCVIVDVGLQNGTGLELVRELRLNGDQISVILVARHIDSSLQYDAKAVDAVALLEVPVPPLVLFAALQEALASGDPG